MRKILFIFLCFLFCNASAQEFTPLTEVQKNELLKGMKIQEIDPIGCFTSVNIEYYPLNNYTYSTTGECFETIPKFFQKVGCILININSDDSNFIALFDIPIVFKENNNREYFSLNSPENQKIINLLKKDFAYFNGQTIEFIDDIKDNIAYLPNHFNADTALIYNINLSPKEKLANKYTKCSALILSNGKFTFELYLFFTEKGYKNREKYIVDLSKMIKFKE